MLWPYKLPLPFQCGTNVFSLSIETSGCFDPVQFDLVWPLQGVVVVRVWKWLMVYDFFFFLVSDHQYSVQLHACSGGAALPLLLATHLHPRAAGVHVGYCVLSHSLPGGAAVQLFAQAKGLACGGSELKISALSLDVYLCPWLFCLYLYVLSSLIEVCFLDYWILVSFQQYRLIGFPFLIGGLFSLQPAMSLLTKIKNSKPRFIFGLYLLTEMWIHYLFWVSGGHGTTIHFKMGFGNL